MTILQLHIGLGIFVIVSGAILMLMVYKTWKIKDDGYQKQLDILRGIKKDMI